MALVYTAYADVESRWVGGDVPATVAQVETLLEDAEDTILGEFPDLTERIEAGLPPRRVKKVAARMVIRLLRNPEGTRSQMDVAGPFTTNKVFGGEEPGGLYMTDEDRAELGGHKVGGAFTIDTTPPLYIAPPDPWVEVTP